LSFSLGSDQSRFRTIIALSSLLRTDRDSFANAGTTGCTIATSPPTTRTTRIRTGQWLTQQVDTLAEQLGTAIATELAAWQVLPPLELATATRSNLRDVETDSPMGDLSAILMSLMRSGIQMPLEHATAYQDFQLGDLALRLYAVIAPQMASPETATPEQNPAEWSLLIIVRRQDRTDLPQGVGLQIADANSMLVDRRTETNQSDFLYGTAIGDVNEEFTVTLSYQDQTVMLPPFTFE
jgi:hypothetical protein